MCKRPVTPKCHEWELNPGHKGVSPMPPPATALPVSGRPTSRANPAVAVAVAGLLPGSQGVPRLTASRALSGDWEDGDLLGEDIE
jgi:hypothetical protein